MRANILGLAGLAKRDFVKFMIAYVDIQPGRPWKTFLIFAQGGAPQEMLAENRPQVDAIWSSDGKKIAFGRNGPASNEVQDISIIELATH
jgi:Tol biopolymer transport system component